MIYNYKAVEGELVGFGETYRFALKCGARNLTIWMKKIRILRLTASNWLLPITS